MEFLKVLFMKMILTAKTNFGKLKENSNFQYLCPIFRFETLSKKVNCMYFKPKYRE